MAARIGALGGSNVTIADTSRNWYADNGISKLSIPKDYQIIELHMDSASASARGGHVIINGKYKADQYDNALAKMISGIFPGRSQIVVGRTDLANPKRAAAKGYPYRLMECGFITSATDVKIFNSRMDDIARGILQAFGLSAVGTSTSTKTETAGKLYRVYEQKGAFKSKANAEALQKKLQKEGKTAIII